MTKFIVLFALLGVITQNSQSIQAKPFLKPNFFVLTTKAPLDGQSSVFGGGFQLTNLILPKIRSIMNILQNTRGKKHAMLGGGLLGGLISPSVTTITKTPDFETSFEAESSNKHNTKVLSSNKSKTDKNTAVDSTSNKNDQNTEDNDEKIDNDTGEEDLPGNLMKKNDKSSAFNDKDNHSISYQGSNNGDKSSINPDSDNSIENNDVADSNYKNSFASDDEDGYFYQNNKPVDPIKSKKYLPPAP